MCCIPDGSTFQFRDASCTITGIFPKEIVLFLLHPLAHAATWIMVTSAQLVLLGTDHLLYPPAIMFSWLQPLALLVRKIALQKRRHYIATILETVTPIVILSVFGAMFTGDRSVFMLVPQSFALTNDVFWLQLCLSIDIQRIRSNVT